MSPTRSTAQSAAQFLDTTPKPSVPWRRLMGLAAVMSGAACLAILLRQETSALVLGLFALFGAIGVAALFASAAGFLHFGVQARTGVPDLSRLYAENASQGIALTGTDGAILYANPVYRHLTGAADIAPLSVESALVRQFGGSEPLFRLIRAARRGETAHEEFQALSAPGAGRWLRASVKRVSGVKDGGTGEALSLWEVSDVTTRREQDLLLVHNIREYRKLLDKLPVGIFLAGADGAIKFVNATLRSWVDLGDREKGAQHKLSTIFAEHAAALLASEVTGGPATASFDLVKRDGTALPVSVLLTRQKGEQEGEEAALFGAVLERHGDADAGAKLNDAERLLGFLKSAPVAIAAVAQDGTITSCNPAFARFFGSVKSL